MNKLAELLKELDSKINVQERVSEKVSASFVGWHIEHALLTIDIITEALAHSNPDKFKRRFSLAAGYVFTTGKIPRGRAQAPDSIRPKNNFDAASLKEHIYITNEKIKVLETLTRNHHFEHPFFGELNLKPAMKFLFIHTKHHLHIINDII